MNVMINDMSKDLDTSVQGVQIAISLLLVMAALIPGRKLTDCWGRKRCVTVGLVVYGIGAPDRGRRARPRRRGRHAPS